MNVNWKPWGKIKNNMSCSYDSIKTGLRKETRLCILSKIYLAVSLINPIVGWWLFRVNVLLWFWSFMWLISVTEVAFFYIVFRKNNFTDGTLLNDFFFNIRSFIFQITFHIGSTIINQTTNMQWIIC